jgi:hypothetical protein
VEIDQIGEDFLASVNAGTTFDKQYDKYNCEVSGNTISVYAKSDTEKETALLYVKAELTEGKLDVMEWRYMLSQTQTE